MKDHPRLRGEQLVKKLKIKPLAGSPPLARGTVHIFLFRLLQMGITPACAGNSFISFKSRKFTKDHPRLRGEQTLSDR